ncbi:MAG: hypothetical protein U0694_07660 [Anaerolineae bacterium]
MVDRVVGVFCILKLLQAGYRVRTTVRSLKRDRKYRAMLKTAGVEAGSKLSFAAADLTADARLEGSGGGTCTCNCPCKRHSAEASQNMKMS